MFIRHLTCVSALHVCVGAKEEYFVVCTIIMPFSSRESVKFNKFALDPSASKKKNETRIETTVIPESKFWRTDSVGKQERMETDWVVGKKSLAGELFRKAKNMGKVKKKLVIDCIMKM